MKYATFSKLLKLMEAIYDLSYSEYQKIARFYRIREHLKWPYTTLWYRLKLLEREGFVHHKYHWLWGLTDKGKRLVEALRGDQNSSEGLD